MLELAVVPGGQLLLMGDCQSVLDKGRLSSVLG